MRKHSAVLKTLWLLSLAALTGCAHGVMVMPPTAAHLHVSHKLPMEAAILITPEIEQQVVRKHPATLAGGLYHHGFPMGRMLRDASLSIFSQLFQQATVVQSHDVAQTYPIYLEPLVQDFAYWIGIHWWWNAYYSQVTLRVVAWSGTASVWEVTRECKPQRVDADGWHNRFVWDWGMHARMGESASKAVSACLQEIAESMAGVAALQQIGAAR